VFFLVQGVQEKESRGTEFDTDFQHIAAYAVGGLRIEQDTPRKSALQRERPSPWAADDILCQEIEGVFEAW
jgi:hypothetical protein